MNDFGFVETVDRLGERVVVGISDTADGRLYARFTLSFRDVEGMLAERGVDTSNETVRRWFLKFGRLIASNLRRSRRQPSARWPLPHYKSAIS